MAWRGVKYLFIVDDERNGNFGIVGPFGIKSFFTVANEVAGDVVVWMADPLRRHNECS